MTSRVEGPHEGLHQYAQWISVPLGHSFWTWYFKNALRDFPKWPKDELVHLGRCRSPHLSLLLFKPLPVVLPFHFKTNCMSSLRLFYTRIRPSYIELLLHLYSKNGHTTLKGRFFFFTNWTSVASLTSESISDLIHVTDPFVLGGKKIDVKNKNVLFSSKRLNVKCRHKYLQLYCGPCCGIRVYQFTEHYITNANSTDVNPLLPVWLQRDVAAKQEALWPHW